jgi:hypothetical protein
MIQGSNKTMLGSVKGKFLSDFPDIVKEIDLTKHKDLDISKIQAGSNQVILNWICIYCKESYQRNINQRTRGSSACPKNECMLLKRSKTNNEKFGWTPKYKLDKGIVLDKKEILEPSENDIEEWREIPTELLLSKYQISNLGRIKNKRTQYILSQNPRKDGYVSNTLFLDDNTQKSKIVHVLVAKTFIDNPLNKPTVNHINMNKSDNRVINLEWATYSEQSYKENKSPYKINGYKRIDQYDLEGNFIKTWDKAIDAERELKIDRRNILEVLKGRQKKSGGFIWKYNKDNDIIDGEIWKKCPLGDDYDKVLVSNLGRIKIKENNPTYGTLRKNGYYDIKILNTKKKYKSYRVHRIVCLAFIENPENKPFVNHKDQNPSNNTIENLEWMTNKENVNYSLDLNNRNKNNKRSKFVIQIDPLTNKTIKEFQSISVASKETKFNYNSISWCCKKFRGHVLAGGYKWSYKSE